MAGEPRLCGICGEELASPRTRRAYHQGACTAEAKRRGRLVRLGRDPMVKPPMAPKLVAKLEAGAAGARGGGVAFGFWQRLFLDGRTTVSRAEVEPVIGKPSGNRDALVQLQRLELLVEVSPDEYEVRGPVTLDARAWVSLCAQGGAVSQVPRPPRS